MKNIKRILALTLVAFMLVSLLPGLVASYAAGDATNTQLSSIRVEISKLSENYKDKPLSPSFNPLTKDYAIIIVEEDKFFYLEFEKALDEQEVTLTMNGTPQVLQTKGERKFALDGFNLHDYGATEFKFVITVTSPDGTASGYYTITLYRGTVSKNRNLKVIDGSADAYSVIVGDKVTITADPEPNGQVFDKWTANYVVVFDEVNSATTSFPMPDKDVTVTANYKDSFNDVTVSNGTIVPGGTDIKTFQKDDIVNIEANLAPEGQVFDKWTSEDGVDFEDANSASTSFTMPGREVTVTATYKDAIFYVDVTNGNGSGDYKAGTKVNISPDLPPTGMMFDKWVSDVKIDFDSEKFQNASFIMPYSDVTVTATYKVGEHNVFVNGGTGGGKYQYNATVTITADPAPAGKVFDKWISYSGISLVDEYSETTSFTMINTTVNVSALYKDAPTTSFSYQVTEGANLAWNKGDKKGARFVIDGDFNLFQGVKLDGLMIDKANYSSEKGSVIVTLLPEFLNTQDEGKYDIDFVFEGKEAKTSFSIAKAATTDPSDPKDPEDTTDPKEPGDSKEPEDTNKDKPKDEPKGSLPSTGENNSGFLLILSLLFIAMGLVLFRRKKSQAQ